MRIKAPELAAHLEAGLAPVYLVAGEEPLQHGEALQAVRARAAQAGFGERTALDVDAGFRWDDLAMLTASGSLFSPKRLFELRLSSLRLGRDGGPALAQTCARVVRAGGDVLLLIAAPKIDAEARKTSWYKAVEASGVVVHVWPLAPGDMLPWLQRRARRHGLSLTRAALQVLAAHTEGNLLAADQELEKLSLLGEDRFDEAGVALAIGNSARYTVFDLADTALAGDDARAARIVESLRQEGADPILALWALARELRLLAVLAEAYERGANGDDAFGRARAVDPKRWDLPRRRASLERATARANGRQWRALLRRAAAADRRLKGLDSGDAWADLIDLAVGIATGVSRISDVETEAAAVAIARPR